MRGERGADKDKVVWNRCTTNMHMCTHVHVHVHVNVDVVTCTGCYVQVLSEIDNHPT